MDVIYFITKNCALKADYTTREDILQACTDKFQSPAMITQASVEYGVSQAPSSVSTSVSKRTPQQKNSFTISCLYGAMLLKIVKTNRKGRYYLHSVRLNVVKLLYGHNARILTESEYLQSISRCNLYLNFLLDEHSQNMAVPGLAEQDDNGCIKLISESYISSVEISRHIFDPNLSFRVAFMHAQHLDIRKQDYKLTVQGTKPESITHTSKHRDFSITAYDQIHKFQEATSYRIDDHDRLRQEGLIRLEVDLKNDVLARSSGLAYEVGERLASLPHDHAYKLMADKLMRLRGLYYKESRMRATSKLCIGLKMIYRNLIHDAQRQRRSEDKGTLSRLNHASLDWSIGEYIKEMHPKESDEKKRMLHTKYSREVLKACRECLTEDLNKILSLSPPSDDECNATAVTLKLSDGQPVPAPTLFSPFIDPRVQLGWSTPYHTHFVDHEVYYTEEHRLEAELRKKQREEKKRETSEAAELTTSERDPQTLAAQSLEKAPHQLPTTPEERDLLELHHTGDILNTSNIPAKEAFTLEDINEATLVGYRTGNKQGLEEGYYYAKSLIDNSTTNEFSDEILERSPEITETNDSRRP